METADFLRLILPPGVRFIITLPGADHVGFANNDEAAQYAASRCDKIDVYHACATYREHHDADNAKQFRTDKNWLGAKSFWIDLDVKADDPKKYPSQKEAIQSLMAWCADSQFPAPTLWVNSGYGIHAYWVTDTTFPLPQWTRAATLFKACLAHGGVKQDTTRTADAKSILRPPGTLNHKRGEAKAVKQFGAVGEAIPAGDFIAALGAYKKQHDVLVPVERDPALPDRNSDLLSDEKYPDVSAEQVAAKCAQIGAIAACGGDVEEPLWRGMIGIVKFCVEGDEQAHAWSQGHPAYDKHETQRKFDLWTARPTTCEYFKQHNPKGCEGCPFKVVSPIRLGELAPEHVEAAVPVAAPFGTGGDDEPTAYVGNVPPLPESMREKYRWTGTQWEVTVQTKHTVKGVDTWVAKQVPFCETDMRGLRYYARNKAYYISLLTLHRGAWREIEVPCSMIGGGGSKLHEELGKQLIMSMPGQKAHTEGFMQAWQQTLKKNADEVKQYDQYGWTEDNEFLVGNRMYRADGTVAEVLTGGDAAQYQKRFEPAGSLERWVELIDRAYNYPGQEQYQVMLCVGFGAPLLKLMRGCHGATIHAMTAESGEGKTTAAQAALSIYGNPEYLKKTQKQTTINAMYKFIGTMGCLPVLYDEATNTKPIETSNLLYSISDGKPKDRLNQDGTARIDALPWTTLVLTTGNRSMVSSVGAGKSNAEAEIARCVEFDFNKVSTLTKEQADELFKELAGHYGTAGDVFMRYVVANREKVTAFIDVVQKRIDAAAAVERKERFWSAAIACIVAGATIAKTLGLINFSVSGMQKWLIGQTRHMRANLNENISDQGEAWGMMMGELGRAIIVTETWGDRRTGRPVEIKQNVVGPTVFGRTILDEKSTYVSQSLVRQWCSEKQVDYAAMVNEARAAGWIDGKVLQVSLGKGTVMATSATKCFKLDRTKMAAHDILDAGPMSLVVNNQ